MTRQDDIKYLIINHRRRLQKLKEKQALYGLETPVHILIEIEDVEATVKQLQAELAVLTGPQSPETAQPAAPLPPEVSSAAGPEPFPPRRTFFVGRQRHLQALHGHWEKTLQRNQGQVVFITGEAGIGKTGLIEQFSRSVLERYPTARYAYARCDQIAGDASPYAPFIQILNSLTGQAARRGDNWTVAYLREVGPDILSMVPVVGPLLAAAAKSVDFAWQRRDRTRPGSDQFGQQDIFQQFADSLGNIARRKNPLLLGVDDWHWADTSSTNLLFHLARQLADAPILLLAAYRPHDAEAREHPILTIQAELERYQLCDRLPLEFLSRAEVEIYLVQRFPEANFATGFIDWLLQTTGGNALFVNEYIELLLNEQRLTPAGQLAGKPDDLPPPESVEAVIRSRLGYLDRDAREMLAYGSIEGEQFTTLLLGRLLEMQPLSLIRKLRAIEETHRLIDSLGQQSVYEQQTTVYRFVHALIHRTLYNMLKAEERFEINRLLLDLLKEIYKQADEAAQARLLPALMTHAAEVGNFGAEAGYALAAAEAAAANYGHDEALKLCNLGLRALNQIEPSTPESRRLQIDVLVRRGWSEDFLGRWQQAIETYGQAEILAEAGDGLTKLPKILNSKGWATRHLGEYAQAVDYHRRAAALAEQAGDDGQVAVAYHSLGTVHEIMDNYDDALTWYQKSLTLTEKLNDRPGVGRAYHGLGIIYSKYKKYDQALECLNRSIDVFSDLEASKSALAWNYNSIGIVRAKQGDYSSALNLHQEALNIWQELAYNLGQAIALDRLGRAHQNLANNAEALDHFQKALVIHTALGRHESVEKLRKRIAALESKIKKS